MWKVANPRLAMQCWEASDMSIPPYIYDGGSGQLALLVKALALLPKGPGFEPDLAPHITCLLFPPLVI